MKNVFLSLLCGLVGALIFTMLNNYFNARPIAVLKLEDVIASHMREVATQEMDESQVAKSSEKFARSLDQVIKKIAEEERVTLLVAPAVVSEVPDYTEYVKAEIRRLMSVE